MPKYRIRKNNYQKHRFFWKDVVRIFLICVFVIMLSLFGILAICWTDSLYNVSRGIVKSPLLNAYIVATESMTPAINVNDAIIVRRVRENTLEIGDVITFLSENVNFREKIVTHRVIGRELGNDGNYIYRTKGDNNLFEDAVLVERGSIYGKVILCIPKVGYIHYFLSTPFGFILSIVMPVLFIIVYEIWRVVKVMKKRYAEVEIL